MGRDNKKYFKDIHQQVYERLNDMSAYGESKKEAIKNGTDKDKIFSYNTYKTYYKHCKYFLEYLKVKHPEVTTMKKARKYVNEWLDYRASQGLSAWTIQTEAKALGKLYGIGPEDPDYYEPPKRRREDIKRSRGHAKRDKHFSEKNNQELVDFCCGTGLRASELEQLRGGDIVSAAQLKARLDKLNAKESLTETDKKSIQIIKDAMIFGETENFVFVRKGKGGRQRLSPIIGPQEEQIVKRIRETPKGEKVWEYVNRNADIHNYRAVYAGNIYKKYRRDPKDIPYDKVNKGTGKRYQSEVYVCRKDEHGRRLDRAAMLKCSKALGHNRVEVVANNYLRGE